MSSSREPLFFDTALLVVVRAGYALACRRFLLAALNPTLRELSTEESLPTLAHSSPSRPRLTPLETYSDTDEDGSRAGTPLQTPNASSMELSEMGEEPLVIKLNHGKSAARPVTKRATRGLSRAARTLFCLCFAEACNLVTLVGLHEAEFLNSRARVYNFSLSFHLILALILVVVPMLQCLLLTYRSSDSPSTGSKISFRSRVLVACIPFALYCFAFTFIPPYVTHSESSGEDWEGEGWLAATLGRVVVLGIVALAGLSGFGAVRTAWNFMEHLKHGRSETLSENDVTRAEQSLYRIRQELAAKRDEANRAPPTPSKGWMGRFFTADQGIGAELDGLQAMERQMARSLKQLKKRKGQQEFSRTLLGQVYNLVGYGFAVYCGARLMMCLPSIFFSPSSEPQIKGNSNGDWISYFVAVALSHFPTIDINVALWSRTISLLLTGVLILSSLAQVLRSVGKIVHLTSRTAGASFLLLALGQLFAVYVISLLIQMRASLQAADEDSLLKTLPDFRTFGRLFDVVFVLAAVSTAVYRYVSLKVT